MGSDMTIDLLLQYHENLLFFSEIQEADLAITRKSLCPRGPWLIRDALMAVYHVISRDNAPQNIVCDDGDSTYLLTLLNRVIDQ